MSKINAVTARKRRHDRIRGKISGTPSRPRLCVFRSLNHIYAQIIDDVGGKTVTSAGSLSEEIKKQVEGKTKTQVAEIVGTTVAEAALNKGIKEVVFDRGGYKYQGRVKALAEAARKAGLKF